jgi:Flp pilus assembly protein TadG
MRRSNRSTERPGPAALAHTAVVRVRRIAAAARERSSSDRGSASIEFLTVGLILLVPLVYLVLALGQIQHAVLGIEGGARHAARALAQADSHEEGLAAADRAIRVAIEDAGLTAEAVRVAITCAPAPGACDTPRGTVSVRLDVTVPLPLAPPGLHLGTGVGVPVSALATQPVSAFGGAP